MNGVPAGTRTIGPSTRATGSRWAAERPFARIRPENLALRGRQAGLVVIGSVVLFFVAALIEGFFRQLVLDEAARWGLALATALFWTAYFGWGARAGRAHG